MKTTLQIAQDLVIEYTDINGAEALLANAKRIINEESNKGVKLVVVNASTYHHASNFSKVGSVVQVVRETKASYFVNEVFASGYVCERRIVKHSMAVWNNGASHITFKKGV
jgi:hypothetical protein